MSVIPENVISAGCVAYSRKFLSGFGSLGDGIAAAYEVMSIHPDLKLKTTWDGEGMPPVGVACEHQVVNCNGWSQITVLAYGERKTFYRDSAGREWSRPSGELKFRSIRTAEQIAEDERNAAICLMIGHVKDHPGGRHGANHLVQLRIQEEACIDLYEAGYRKQVTP